MAVEFGDDDPQPSDFRWVHDADSNPRAILTFLADNPETRFTPKEIAEATDVPRGSVGTTLSRLEEQGLVRHTETDWAIAEDDRLAAFEAMLVSTESEVDRKGDDWDHIDESEFTSDDEMEAWRRRQEG